MTSCFHELRIAAKNRLARHAAHDAEQQALPWVLRRGLSDFAPKELADEVAAGAVNLTRDGCCGHTVEREDVDEDALLVRHVLLMLTQERRPFAAELAIAPSIPRRIFVILEIEAARVELGLTGAAEFFVLPAQERDVGIVVPGDEAAMAHGTEQRPRNDVVVNAALPADTIGLEQQFELDALQLVQLFFVQLDHLMYISGSFIMMSVMPCASSGARSSFVPVGFSG